MQITKPYSQPTQRRGAALVEFAIVLPLLLMMLVGSIEIGRAITVRQTLSEAARAGARVYSMQTKKTKADAEAIVAQIMAEAGLKKYTVAFEPETGIGLKHLDPVTVTISVTTADASWYPSPWYLGTEKPISSRSVMPADLGKTAISAPEAPANTDPVPFVDRDPVKELSGFAGINLKELEKEAAKLIEKAIKLREKADKQFAKADEKFAEAQEKLAEGDLDKYEDKMEDYQKELAKANELAAETYVAEQLARDALAKSMPTP